MLLGGLAIACSDPEGRPLLPDAASLADASGSTDAGDAEDVGGEADGSAPDADAPDPREITWYRDVVPVVQSRCVGCHHESGVAPFSMESYESAAPWAHAMAYAVFTGYMPPWPPHGDCQSYLDARVLSDREISMITRWAAAGAPAGEPSDAPPPQPPKALDRVDVEADPGVDYTPTRTDDYRCFAVDLGLARREQVVGLEIVPGVPWMVHHVVLFQANAAQAESADALDPGPGWSCFGGPGVAATSATDSLTIGAWAPGTPVARYPEGTGVDLALGNVVVMQVHYHLDGSRPAAPDRTTIRMKLADQPVTSAYVLSIYDYSFAIPPRDPASSQTTYESAVRWPLTLSGTLHGVFPHMHLLGRTIELTYSPPGSSARTCLADIPVWDFHWQQFYFYDSTGIRLEAGGALDLRCQWHRPPAGGRTVYWGEGSDDEMCIVGLYLTP